MINRDEAWERAKNAECIRNAKGAIEGLINEGVECGNFDASMDVTGLTNKAKEILMAWVRSFGYTCTLDQWDVSSGRGMRGTALRISWKKED